MKSNSQSVSQSVCYTKETMEFYLMLCLYCHPHGNVGHFTCSEDAVGDFCEEGNHENRERDI